MGINDLPGAVAAGGLIAMIVAGWQQVKGFFAYVSGLVVVRAQCDPSLKNELIYYLKAKWRVAPSGLFNYRSLWRDIAGSSNLGLVPFRVLNAKNIFYRKWQVAVVNLPGNGMNIYAIRGTLNFEDLIKEALAYTCHIDGYDEAAETGDRFNVYKMIGDEKGSWALGSRRSNKDGPGVPSSSGDEVATTAESRGLEIDISVDKSFMYRRDEYIFKKKDNSFDALYFSPEVLAYIDQAKRWARLGDWHAKRGIPHRRGWMLHGPGGTGKSSLAKATAQCLGMPIYHYFLATLSDQEFMEKWRTMHSPCFVLFEDFDNVFNKRVNLTEHKSLTFDCVLNQISGIDSMNGIFLIVTTNHIDKIDEAMGISWGKDGISTRPGRIDSVIYVGHMNNENKRKMADRILCGWPDEIHKVMLDCEEVQMTPIQFEETCLQRAFKKLSKLDMEEYDTV